MKESPQFTTSCQNLFLACDNSEGLFSFIKTPKLNLKFFSFKYVLAAE